MINFHLETFTGKETYFFWRFIISNVDVTDKKESV